MSYYMIPKAKELKLISIYLYICDIYESSLKNVCQRWILLHKKHVLSWFKTSCSGISQAKVINLWDKAANELQLHLYF
jgi:hypothetical protein